MMVKRSTGDFASFLRQAYFDGAVVIARTFALNQSLIGKAAQQMRERGGLKPDSLRKG